MLNKIINNKILILFFIPFFLGLLSTFSFQPYNYVIINFLILPTLFFILTYVNKRSKNVYRKKPYFKNLFYIGYFFGVGYFFSNTYWISYALTFDENFKFLIPFSLIFIPLFLALFFGLATLFVGPFLKNNFPSILIFCASLSFLDFLRSKLFTGFPWNLWPYSLTTFPEFLQLTNKIGFFAFNLIIITMFCLPTLIFFKNKKINFSILAVSFSLLFCNYFYGSIIINKYSTNNKSNYQKKLKEMNLKIISPNFDLKYNLNSDDVPQLIKKLIRSSDPNDSKETIFLWPEGVFTGYDFGDIYKFRSLIKNSFSKNHKIVFGINRYEKNLDSFFNSLVIINNDFDILYQYNKKKLVPFGEFLPFENILNKFGFKKITYGYGSFLKGSEQNNYEFDGISILPLICYEIIFPELIQKSNINTNLIINISEDAWFRNSVGPYQHFSKAIFRAIESDTIVARSANKGFSAIINSKGQILKSLKPTETGNIEMNININKSENKNRNDLIFFLLLFTYTIIFFTFKNKL